MEAHSPRAQSKLIWGVEFKQGFSQFCVYWNHLGEPASAPWQIWPASAWASWLCKVGVTQRRPWFTPGPAQVQVYSLSPFLFEALTMVLFVLQPLSCVWGNSLCLG